MPLRTRAPPDHGCAWYVTDVLILLSSQLSCHVHQAPNPWLVLKLKIKMFKDFVSRETVRLAWQAAPGAHRGGRSLPDLVPEEVWLSSQSIFQHLPARGASIFQTRDPKGTQGHGSGQSEHRLLSTTDKPLWGTSSPGKQEPPAGLCQAGERLPTPLCLSFSISL